MKREKKNEFIIIQIILLLDRHSSHRLSETMYKAIVVISNINNMHPSITVSLKWRIQDYNWALEFLQIRDSIEQNATVYDLLHKVGYKGSNEKGSVAEATRAERGRASALRPTVLTRWFQWD